MKTITNTGMAVACCALALLVGGCSATKQARRVDPKMSLLVDPSIFKKGASGYSLYSYVNPKADIRKYSKVMLVPVLVLKQGDLTAKDRENYQALANNALVFLTKELQQDYDIVQAPAPDAFKFQLAINDAADSSAVSSVISSVGSLNAGIALVEYGVSGKEMGVGEITCELKVTDSMTGELIAAALDRRVGRKSAAGVFGTWHSANAALQYWAKRSRYSLCKARGGVNCIKP